MARGQQVQISSPQIVETVSLDSSGITVPRIMDERGEVVVGSAWDWIKAGADFIVDQFKGGGPQVIPTQQGGFAAPAPLPCPPLTFRGPGGTCIDVLAGAPGGRPMITRRTGTDVGFQGEISEGIFGLLSTQPDVVGDINGRPILRCPVPGLVLGKDDRCYSKKDLPAKLRKWPPHKCRSATDRKIKAIKAAGAAADSLKRSFKGSGFKISKTGK